MKMDMSEYAGGSFLKLADVREPRREIIAEVVRGNFERPDAWFESGNVLSLNKTSVRALIKAYGKESPDWVGKEIELYAGQVDTKDGKTDAVLVTPISPPTVDEKLPPPKAANGGSDMNDEIPF